MANLPAFVNFYVPFTADEEFEKLENLENRYIMDFRAKASTSESSVKQTCTYMAEGMPMARVAPTASDVSYERLGEVFQKVMPREVRQVNWQTSNPDVIPHPLGLTNYYGYQGIYSEFLIEQTYTLPRPGDNITISYAVINSNHAIVENGYITGYSKPLQEQIDTYKKLYNIASTTPIRPEQLFGSTYDTNGVNAWFFYTSGSTISYSRIYYSAPVTVGSYVGSSAGYGNGWLVFETNDPYIKNPTVGITAYDNVLDLYKQGGGKTTTGSKASSSTSGNSASTLPAGDGPAPNIKSYTNVKREVYGTGVGGSVVTIMFENGSTASTLVGSGGTWTIKYPASVDSVSSKDTLQGSQSTQGSVSQNTLGSSSELGTEIVTTVEPVIQTSMGLPVLKLKQSAIPNTLFSSNMKNHMMNLANMSFYRGGTIHSRNITKDTTTVVEYVRSGKTWSPRRKTVATDITDTFFLFAFYIGRDPYEDPNEINNVRSEKTFLSYPKSIIQQLGVTILFAMGGVENGVALSPLAYDVFTASGKRTPFYRKTLTPNYSFTWELGSLISSRMLYKFNWSRLFDNTKDQYKFSWQKNADVERKKAIWKVKWDREKVYFKTKRYYFRYDQVMPEDSIKKNFYVINWDVLSINKKILTYKIKSEIEMSRTKVLTWKTSWDNTLLNPCLIRPYYISLYDSASNTYTDSVSYQVYGDPKFLDSHIANNNFYCYFSNPSKFELVKFDYNLQPYDKEFLIDLRDPNLGNLELVPSNYALIGNYTIKGIDIRGSLSLDIIAGANQVNESKSYWIPDDLAAYSTTMITLSDGKSKALPLDGIFRDDHNVDVVELDLVILDETECCFTQKSSGTRCSPY